MKAQLCLFLLAASMAQVRGTCNVGVGNRQRFDFEIYTLHANKGPVSEAQNMTLVFDYQVNPVETIELTFVQIITSMESNCVTIIPANISLKTGFNITVSTTISVQTFSGTATIYGIQRGN